MPFPSIAMTGLMPHENLLSCCEMGMGAFGHGLLFKEKTGYCSFALSYLLPLIIFWQLAMYDSMLARIWQLAELI